MAKDNDKTRVMFDEAEAWVRTMSRASDELDHLLGELRDTDTVGEMDKLNRKVRTLQNEVNILQERINLLGEMLIQSIKEEIWYSNMWLGRDLGTKVHDAAFRIFHETTERIYKAPALRGVTLESIVEGAHDNDNIDNNADNNEEGDDDDIS